MQPAKAINPPIQETFVLDSSPVAASVRPNANRSGQTVGEGRFTWSGAEPAAPFDSCAEVIYPRGPRVQLTALAILHLFFESPAHNIDRGENDHPDGVNEVPIEREHLATVRVLGFNLAQ